MMARIPGVRLSPSLLPTEISDDAVYCYSIQRAMRLARTDSREQFFSVAGVSMGDEQLMMFVNLLSGRRRRLDGVGAVSCEPWHGSEDGVNVTLHQAQERAK